MLFNSTAQKSREYSHGIDLTLNIHFEAVISDIHRTTIPLFVVLGVKQEIQKKVRKGPAAPTPICWGRRTRGWGRADLKNAGVQNISSVIWTLVVKQKNMRVNPEGVGKF